MPDPVTGIIGGSTLFAAGSAKKSADKANKTTKDASAASLAESQRQFDLTRADTAPYREAGTDALGRIRTMFLGSDPTAFRDDPGHQFSVSEGQRAIDNSLVARGKGLSGAAVKAGVRYATGMADQHVSSIFGRLATIAGIGQGGVNTSAQVGANTAGTVANINMNAAAQRGSSYMAGAAGMNNAVQGGLGNLMLQRYLTPPISGGGTQAMNWRGPIAGGGLV